MKILKPIAYKPHGTGARRRFLVTSASRSQITAIVINQGEWTGVRRGVKMRITHNPEAPAGCRIAWESRINRQTFMGVSASVSDAIAAIETQAADPPELKDAHRATRESRRAS